MRCVGSYRLQQVLAGRHNHGLFVGWVRVIFNEWKTSMTPPEGVGTKRYMTHPESKEGSE